MNGEITRNLSMLNKFKQITTFAFDVDGVLTDGSIILFDDGQQVRKMNIKDGYALQLAIKKGYRVVVISGGTSDAVRQRLNKLGIHDVFLKVDNKVEVLEQYRSEHNLHWQEILFMGDDIPDYSVMEMVGMPCSPSDAVPEIKHISTYISPARGGEGCVRDVIEKVMKLRGHWSIDSTVSSK